MAPPPVAPAPNPFISSAALIGRVIADLEAEEVPVATDFLLQFPILDANGHSYIDKLLIVWRETIRHMKVKAEGLQKAHTVVETKLACAEERLLAGKEERDKVHELSERMDKLAVKVNSAPRPKPGSVTRSDDWQLLVLNRCFSNAAGILPSTSNKRVQLLRNLNPLEKRKFPHEIDMYEPVIKAIKTSLYPATGALYIVDTHKRTDIAADPTVARFPDGRAAYTNKYWMELKLFGVTLTTPTVRGQMLDYLRDSCTLQPWRAEAIGILSNLGETWVFTGTNSPTGFKVTVASAPTFADAILYAHDRTKDLVDQLPDPDRLFEGAIEVLSATNDHYLYSASAKHPQHPQRPKNIVVVKMHVVGGSLKNEIDIFKRLSKAPHKNIAVYFWSSDDYTQLAITPQGVKITTKEPASVSRLLVRGLLDGLEWLHSQHIVHRDIRLSNVILNQRNEAVIIDFQTAVDLKAKEEIRYLGGRICWPRRLLISGNKNVLYTPTAQDDLHAAVLFVMHLLFPPQFDSFGVENIMKHESSDQPTKETNELLRLWTSIAGSSLWSRFFKAAEECSYKELSDMASLFYSPEAL